MKIPLQLSVLLVLMWLAGCDSGHGLDSLFAPQAGGAATSGCVACHNSTSTIAPDPLVTNGSGTYGKHISHVQSSGIPCERCHFNYAQASTHMTGTIDTGNPAIPIVYFDSLNPPPAAWTNDTGPGTGTCSSLFCHGGYSVDWYGAGLPGCAACHFQQMGSRRPVLGANGDFASNPTVTSHHVRGGSDPTPDQCKVCHEMSQHTSGTVRLKQADTGAAIAYNPASPNTLEPFCLSCHDADSAVATFISGGTPTSPFNDGSVLGSIPNEAGNKIASFWSAAYTVHRNNGLTCAGTGAPVTGCHGNAESINMHGSTSKGILTRNMTLPIPSFAAYDYNQFKLCFDCHESYPSVTKEVVLGYKQGGNYDLWWAPSPYSTPTTSIRSLFRDRYIFSSNSASYPPYWNGSNQPYNENFYGEPYTPLHNWHLSAADSYMQNKWNYRGSGNIGRATCITCHNVHGTNSAVRSTYEELGLSRGSGLGPDEFVTFGGSYALQAGPINCVKECHSVYGITTYYWHTPADE